MRRARVVPKHQPGNAQAKRDGLRRLGGVIPGRREVIISAPAGHECGVIPGDMYIAYITGDNIAEAFTQFAASQTEFDRWFKQQLQETTGADMNTPPSGPISEILADTMA